MDQSTALHFFRGCAALLVAFHHVRNNLFPDYKVVLQPALWFKVVAFLAGFGPQAVILFFVLSGWLVGGKFLKTSQKTQRAYASYTVDRVSRLWTVLLPFFVLQMVLHSQFGVYPQVNQSDFTVSTLVGNLFGLQTIYFAYFGGNHPLWSLANETAYYVLFPLLTIVLTSRFTLTGRVVALVFAIAYATILTQQILLYFTVWLVGVAGCILPFRKTYLLYVAIPLLVIVATYCRIHGIELNIYADLLLATLFAVCIWSTAPSRIPNQHFRRIAVLVASFSFTLYVAHVPIIWTLEQLTHFKMGFADPSLLSGLLYFAAYFIATVLIAFSLYLVGEAHTQTVREKIKVLVGIK
jgi:peptidoglycan/LPS O-acetylase OafA/YrhL